MNQQQHKKTSHAHKKGTSRQMVEGNDIVFIFFQAVVAASIVGRLLVPPEASVSGETLWLVQLWFAAGVLWAWSCFRDSRYRMRLDKLDLLLWVIVLGHVVSAIYVFTNGGQKRLALNMLWEWVGLGVSFFLIRQALRGQRDAGLLASIMVAVTVSLAGMGLWQHYDMFPRRIEQYDQQMSELENPQSERHFQELRRDMIQQGIPLQGPERFLFEARLRASSEPLGLFALANTFAGLLIVWMIVALAMLYGGRNETAPAWMTTAMGLAVGLIGFCLVLTKSRTAWVGLAAGLAFWCWMTFGPQSKHRNQSDLVNQAPRSRGRWPLWISLGLVVLVGVFAVAGLSGGFDKQVVTEAPKSLKYRLQYWSGATQVVRERPLLGTGPGNFRQHYLKYKVPESSEEISDPHNFLLDVWTSGGIIALLGLLAMIAVGGRMIGDSQTPSSMDGAPSSRNTFSFRNPLVTGTILGFASVWVVAWFPGDMRDLRLWVLPVVLAGTLAVLVLISRWVKGPAVGSQCIAAGAVALLVHLLGAGGIEMPAVTQSLLILLALATVRETSDLEVSDASASESTAISGLTREAVVGGVGIALFVGCLFSSTLPVFKRDIFLATGEAALNNGRLGEAGKMFQKADNADPLSPKPVERLAELRFVRWMGARSTGDADFLKIVNWQQEAINRNPDSANGYRKLGLLYLKKFEKTEAAEDAEKAVEALNMALDRYPNSAAILADSAAALEKAGHLPQARLRAQQALDLDKINHREGHQDKYLPQNVRNRLDRILNVQAEAEKRP